MTTEAILLTDNEVSRFITDGFLILPPDVPADVHERIDERLLWLLHKEGNPGNNVLPAVPEMYTVLNSPVVRGALTSILGPDYVLHPHRYVHNNEPGKVLEDGTAKVGEGSHSFVGWHQDDHSPLSRPRHHYPRYAMILYYPQDTPSERGPTQIIPATHFSKSNSEADRKRGMQASGPAGTCVLLHFDLVHGGSLNTSHRSRNMVKFVFARCSDPVTPTWNCRNAEWRTPEAHKAPVDYPVVWRRQWDWMSGRHPSARRELERAGWSLKEALAQLETEDIQQQIDAAAELGRIGTPAAIAALIDLFRSEEPVRQAAIYNLALAGDGAISRLKQTLMEAGSNGTAQKSAWNEGAVVMEDAAYALAAIGVPAIPELVSLLGSGSEWIRVNAAFALGEMGSQAASAMPDLINLLGDASHPVVRTALDSISQIRVGSRAALPQIRRLMELDSPPDSWLEPQRRKWSGLAQVRTNAAMTLLRMGSEADGAEEWLGEVLDDDCGYVGGFGIEYLMRRDTLAARRIAIDYLYRHRWDNTLQGGIRTF